MGGGDPQDPLRVSAGRDDEEEQLGARALLPEDLPSVVGTPGPGEGEGQAWVGPAPGRVLLLAPEAPDAVHPFQQTKEVTTVTGVHLVRLPPAPPDDLRGPRAPSPTPDSGLWRGEWAEWLARLPPQCQWMANGP